MFKENKTKSSTEPSTFTVLYWRYFFYTNLYDDFRAYKLIKTLSLGLVIKLLIMLSFLRLFIVSFLSGIKLFFKKNSQTTTLIITHL